MIIWVQEFLLPLESVAVQVRAMMDLEGQISPEVSSKLYIVEAPLTPMVNLSALPSKLAQPPRPLPAAR